MAESGENVTTHQDITTRLAALNRWQEEQKRLLEQRQNNQRLMLGIEQRNMYQMLGLLHGKLDKIGDNSDDSLSDNEPQQELEASHVSSIQMPRHADYHQKDLEQDDDEEETEQVGLEFNAHQGSSQSTVKPKRPFLRRGEGLKQRFKVDPEQLRLNNLPRYKFANAHPQYRMPAPGRAQKRSILKTAKVAPKAAIETAPKLCLKEQRFQQQLLMSGKNVCSSTPDLKSSSSSNNNTNSTVSPKVRFVADPGKGQSADDEEESSRELTPSALQNLCWAKVLDSQQIKPPLLQRRSAQICVENDDNISIFELLEQKAREGSIDMNSSCIRTFMARKEQRRQSAEADDSDQIVVTQQLRQMRLQPEVSEVMKDNDDEDDENSTLTPLKIGNGKTQVRVRFSDSTDTHEYSDETTLQDDGSNVQLFEEFKAALFQALEQKKMLQPQLKTQAVAEEPLTQELQEKANLVRTRLQELEAEIATFKQQNAELLRLKQQHEVERAQCAQEHMEAMERVHDEKIQAEIYLHDERMKIEEERRKFEQQMRMQKSNVNSKEKKEQAALKHEVESLQLQLKQKEQNHVSAQARLRAQLRASEKEQRGLHDEIELLQRENKRLEQELVKITRENNSKMLQEINRNIARLAPKVETTLPATKHVDENGRRPSKSLGDASKDKPTKRCVPLNRRHSSSRIRKKPEPMQEDCASSSSNELDEVPLPTVRAAAAKASHTVETTVADMNNSNNSEFKREIVNADGSKDIWYPNGNLKKMSSDGMSVRMLYFNKDIKETDIRAGTVKYYYAETNTWHTTYLDGLEILEFPNGQTEHRRKDGTVEIHFPNNTIKIVDPSDAEKLEEWRYADGTHLVQLRNGDKILNLPNGQKEIHTKLNKRREYPDGTVKLVYPDGSQETRYSNGRVRLKDKDGKLIMDTDYAKY
ncbi:hypothetical protein KR093_003039 [Drosophila rubida]|uniref:Centromere protein J C-terminal domain-containing protein n=1 Tax=Drosophila rubida TaxID=30044 RepID=A0AAD4K6W8_9MUSC|nr:hypothetical protein KR093_003039 [Drosophila rubida]